MNIQDFAKNFGKNRDLNKKQEAPKQEAPKQEAPKQEAPKQEAPKQEAPRTPYKSYEKVILVKIMAKSWVFYNDPRLGYYRGDVGAYNVEGVGALDSGVYLCKADLHHVHCGEGQESVFVVKEPSTPKVQTFTSTWSQTFGWFDLPVLEKEIGVGKAARAYFEKNKAAVAAYLLWQEWNLAEYNNKKDGWSTFYYSEDCQSTLLDLLVRGVLEHQIDMVKFKMTPSITVFQNSNVDVEVTFDKTHPASRYMPRRKHQMQLTTQTKMPESIVPTHSRHSQRSNVHSDGMSFFDGRWVRESEAGWCDPDWTSGD